MPGSLRRHAQTLLARYLHHGHHILDGLGDRHRRRMLVDGQVPGSARIVPFGVLRSDDPAAEAGRELLQDCPELLGVKCNGAHGEGPHGRERGA